jgi:hypothetical protein
VVQWLAQKPTGATPTSCDSRLKKLYNPDMRWDSETILREWIEDRTRQLASEIMNLPDGASELSEEMLTAVIELGDLHSELSSLIGGANDRATDRSRARQIFSESQSAIHR